MLAYKHYLSLVLNGKSQIVFFLKTLSYSLFRYISIIHPIKISSISRRNRLYLTFIFIWSLGFIIALPNLYLLKLHPFYNRPRYYICGLSDQWKDSHLIVFYKYTESVFFFFLPAFIQVSSSINRLIRLI
jgi:hypothetical protein